MIAKSTRAHDHGYVTIDIYRFRAILRAEAAHGEPYDGYRVVPRQSAATRVRAQYDAARQQVQAIQEGL